MTKLLELIREHSSLIYYKYVYIKVVELIIKKMKEEFPIKGNKKDILKWYKEWLE